MKKSSIPPTVLPFVVLASLLAAATAFAQSTVTLTHVHGLAYSADGKRLMVPSHHGLAVYSGGRWSKAPGPQHDYMGFAATRTRLYSSGHPAPNTGFKNPFGVIRSRDGGNTWERLGMEGETDFHELAAGWNTNAIYVWNPAPNSRMRRAGLHYTLNDGFKWEHVPASGLSGELYALATHPDEAKYVAAATTTGIYLSRDYGATFAAVASNEQGLAVFFDLDGQYLWYSTFAGLPRLTRITLDGKERTPMVLPALQKDAVAYIAQNPVDRRQYAIATFERSVFISRDAGRTWQQIADRGRGQ